MLIEATEENVREWKDVLCELAFDPARSSYPLFSDGIKTREELLDYVVKGLHRENRASLFYLEGGATLGLIQYFTIPADRYLQLCGCYLARNTQAALGELLPHLEARYPDYGLYFGFPDKNKEAARFLEAHGFSLIEDDHHDVLLFSDYQPRPCSEHIRRITAACFADFRRLHRADPTTYWTSDRILASLDQWNLYVYDEGTQPVAAIMETNGEIFGMEFQDGVYRADLFTELVVKVLNELKAAGQKDMTFFNDDETQQAALDIGFRWVGDYHLYYKDLKGRAL